MNELLTPLTADATAALGARGADLARRFQAAAADPAALQKAARDFESVLLERLLEEMRRTIPKCEFLSGAGTEQVEGLFWMHLARDLASRGGLGLAEDLIRRFEAGRGTPEPPVHMEHGA